MEPDAPPGELYDFLYRDSSRITSYYAQFFGGHLSSVEDTASNTHNVETGAGVDIQVASGDVKNTRTTGNENKRIINPHDLITTDVLSALMERNYIHSSIEEAPHGALVIVQGTIVFVERSVVDMGFVALDAMMASQSANTVEDQQAAMLLSMTRDFLTRLTIPSAFLLQSQNGSQVAGTLKNEGMEEPISTYYFKHGTAGLSDVFLIGIKEVPSPGVTLPDTGMISAGQQAAQGLRDMLFPPDAMMVTPVALFRKVEPQGILVEV